MPHLLSPVALGALDLPNRILMVSATLSRTTQPSDVPNEMMARFYAQRASAGLIVAEAAQISPQGKGASFTPGIHSQSQIAGWRRVTEAVHAAGGLIFLQLGHAGRMSHASFHSDGRTVAPSAVAPRAKTWVVDPITKEGGMADCPIPRALETEDVSSIVEDFRQAAENAQASGFDGVEIHGGNGYLIDQFLRRSSNRRSDQYGGSTANRARFLIEVARAVSGVFGAERTGVRLSPFLTQRGMADDEISVTTLTAVEELEKIGLAYIHLAEADFDGAQRTPRSFRARLRKTFTRHILVGGSYDLERAHGVIWDGYADAVAFDQPFITNPDLPRRLRLGLPIASVDQTEQRIADEMSFLVGGGFDEYEIA